LAGSVRYNSMQNTLRRQLFNYLSETLDPRVVGGKVDWDYYPYYGRITTEGWAVDPKPKENR